MNLEKTEFAVGIFVIFAFFCLIFLALKVSGLQNFDIFGKNVYIQAHFGNIGGLKVNSAISIAGVNVGKVTDITLDTGDDTRYEATVSMQIKPNIAKIIPDDSSASILTSGLIGEQYISITPGSSETFIHNGTILTDTYSAMILENLIGQMVYNKLNSKK